ncbi:dynamin family protein [Bacillus sp. B1-b2]|uniref:dynamin family protein n=1 Tax=Bacillus sp. B1-b2 TaxID=2653201 RepID=UPI00126284F8|nr:dynamin family protein [Bacillus sp. B1-b2]KAB7672979.1 hypothetical protein F9279_00715 [Bacillus sp. B1-b2]
MLSTNKWSNFYHYYKKYEDLQSANRLKELYEKARKDEMIFTFTGHYSAGKSSMINALLEQIIMPTSPIPTTANIFKIKKGKNQIKVSFPNRKASVFSNCKDVDAVINELHNTEDIRQIEIQLEDIPLSVDSILMDTPGIDSTDSAHELATESSIHLADFIFYVVDYNHVQSEVNFQFTKELSAAGKKFILVVNQMDKHREEEITLSAFKESVNHAFSSYEIFPEDIIYTSTMVESPFNKEMNSIRAYMEDKRKNKEKIYVHTLAASFQKIYKDHQRTLTKRFEGKIANEDSELQELSQDQYNSLEERLHMLNQRLEMLDKEENQYIKNLDDEWNTIIKNAYIMPYQMREVAKAYLEVEQKNVKIGIFTSKQKVVREKEKRTATFIEHLKEIVRLQLISPLIQFLEKNGNKQGAEYFQQLDSIVQVHTLKDLVNKDAQFSENYVLLYCESVENKIKQSIKREMQPIFSEWTEKRQKNAALDKKEIEKEKEEVSLYVAIKIRREQLLDKFSTWKINLEKLHETEALDEEPYVEELFEIEEEISYKCISKADKERSKNKEEEKRELEGRKQFIEHSGSVDNIIEKLQFLSQQITPLKGFAQVADQLSSKAQDIRNRSYTICLFGAFSAGKSSFANALLEFPLLPVSPNPTTATINRILPVDIDHPNKTVVINWKSEEEMLHEINDYLQLIKKKAVTLEEAIQIIQTSEQQPIEKYANEFRYLQAFSAGYSINGKSLGTERTVSLEKLADYVSVEQTSCFIASIDVYYDCSLTRKGITLIDTPGGDSINSRHTELSFEFMKKADCIFYVSYYNHAFAKADQAFLQQLGRLKEAFEKDKIFFVINAIDLAKNEMEQSAVIQYLREQLQIYGIHSPRILPVSSLYYNHSIYGKWMDKTKEELSNFIEHEWLEFMLRSASRDYSDTVELLHKLLSSVHTKKHESKQELIRIYKEKKTILALLNQNPLSGIEGKQKREVEEQLYYVKQRIFFRLTEIIKEAFHPSILRGENKKKEMSNAITSFLIQVNYEFEQELRVVTLRLNQFLQKIVNEEMNELVEILEEVNTEMKLHRGYSFQQDLSIKYHAPFKQLDEQVYRLGNKHFKNPKNFFEQQGRKILIEDLERLIDEHSKEYMREISLKMEDIYQSYVQENKVAILQKLNNQIEYYYEGKMALFTDEENILILENVISNIESYR